MSEIVNYYDFVILRTEDFTEIHLERIETYIAEYCSTSLKRFRAYQRSIGQRLEETHPYLEHINKPFPNVEFLAVFGCICKPDFLKLFPGLESLILHNNRYITTFMAEHLPKLKELKIFNYSVRELDYHGILEMIKLNPQLEKFEILFRDENENTSSLIAYINEYRPDLRYSFYFGYFYYLFYFPNYFWGRVKPFRYAENLDFQFVSANTVDFGFKNIELIDINSFTFSKVQRVSLGSEINLDQTLFIQTLVNFLHKNKNVTSVELFGSICGNLDRVFELEYILTYVEELRILDYQFKDERTKTDNQILSSAIRLLTDSKSLKKLIINGYDSYDFRRKFFDTLKSRREKIEGTESVVKDEIQNTSCEECRTTTKPGYKSMEVLIKKTTNLSLMRYIFTYQSQNFALNYTLAFEYKETVKNNNATVGFDHQL